ncbi:hypothetical protein BGZ83_010542 [Gryganskiella cystojenkinii]|nr:hypothetical protein BGZ83_010542 [Gryganskiella cystojenkinii]
MVLTMAHIQSRQERTVVPLSPETPHKDDASLALKQSKDPQRHGFRFTGANRISAERQSLSYKPVVIPTTMSSVSYIKATTMAASALDTMHGDIASPPPLLTANVGRDDGDRNCHIPDSVDPSNDSAALQQIHALYRHQQLLQVQQEQQHEAYQLIVQQQLQRDQDREMDLKTEMQKGV